MRRILACIAAFISRVIDRVYAEADAYADTRTHVDLDKRKLRVVPKTVDELGDHIFGCARCGATSVSACTCPKETP